MPSKRALVLIVDDDPLDRFFTRRAFERIDYDFELLELNDGQALLDYAEENGLMAVALILLDMKMPRIDGLETLRQLRREDPAGATPVVMMTSSALPQDTKTAYDLGVQGFVTKPMDPAEFREVVAGIGNFWIKYNRIPV